MSDTDTEKLRQYFPNEVWEAILENISSVGVYEACSDASPYFRSFLKARSVLILFPEVANILINKYSKSPFSKHILRCREACRFWKMGVDYVLQTATYFYEFPRGISKWSEQQSRSTNQEFEKFENVLELVKCQQFFDVTHEQGRCNPFLTRGLTITINADNATEFYYHTLLNFLKKYGHHIWYCTIYVMVDDNFFPKPLAQLNFYKTLPQIMAFMSQLRAFEVDLCYLCSPKSVAERLLEVVPENVIKQICIRTLPKLHFLNLVRMPYLFVKKIVRANPQVQVVDGRLCCYESLKLFLEAMPKLARLAIEINNDENLNVFANAQVNCHIVHLFVDTGCKILSLDKILQTLETSSYENLSELTLRNLGNGCTRLRITKQLLLASLKILYLDFRFVVPLDFILPLANTLEMLTVATTEVDETMELAKSNEHIINLYEFWKTPEMSNIWCLFPKLKVLKTYQRTEMYYCIYNRKIYCKTRDDYKMWKIQVACEEVANLFSVLPSI